MFGIRESIRGIGLALVAAWLAGFAAAAERPARPNVLFVIADQWRAQALGCAGDPNVKTPHIDAFQKQAVWFVNAVATLPVCCPTRASILTGQRPTTHGVFLNDVPLSTSAPTMAQIFGKAGYQTGYIGKWHLNGDGRSAFIPPERRQGFDYWKSLECTHDYNHSFYYGDGPDKLAWEGYDAIAQTRDGAQYFKELQKLHEPFLLFLAWGPPHDPYQSAPAKFRELYSPEAMNLRPNVPADAAEQTRKDLAGYYAHCSALDACFGDLLLDLRESGLESNTIVIFTSDHGDMLGSHGMRHKQKPFDESVCVPFFIRWPAAFGTGDRKLPTPIGSEDILPTLLGLCRLPIPQTVEGKDFTGYIRGGQTPGDRAALIECVAPFGEWTRRQGGREFRGIRTERHTYVRGLDGPWLLFDNSKDPFQTNNLAGVSAASKLQAEMDGLLTRKLRAAKDEFLPADDYIRKWKYQVDANGTVPYSR